MAEEVRGMRGLTEDERSMAKLMFVTGQYTLAQVARIMRIDYNTLRAVSSHEKWGDERAAYTLEVAGASAATMHALTEGFKLRCFRMFDRMMANYDEIMDRHEVHDSFQSFPFENFWRVMQQMVDFMRAVGALHVNPQINVNMQQNNIDQRTQQLVSVDGAKAKEALSQILQEFVRNRKPHDPLPVTGGKAPQPETGQYR